MWENFFKHIDIKPENAHILDGNAPDLVKECKDYEAKITAAGGIHLFIGGAYLFLQDFVAVVFLQDFVASGISAGFCSSGISAGFCSKWYFCRIL